MHFQWGFPLLVVPWIAQDPWLSINIGTSGVACLIAALFGFIGLTNNAKAAKYDQLEAQGFYVVLAMGLIVWVLGVIPIGILVIAFCLVLLAWRFIIYWFLWRILAKNALVALGLIKVPRPEAQVYGSGPD